MNKRKISEHNASVKPKVSELRIKFEFIKASFAVEGLCFSEDELKVIEESIRRRHRGPGLSEGIRTLLTVKAT